MLLHTQQPETANDGKIIVNYRVTQAEKVWLESERKRLGFRSLSALQRSWMEAAMRASKERHDAKGNGHA